MTIELELKIINGLIHLYPRCKQGKTMAQIAKTKTLTPETLERYKKLDFDFVINQKTL